MSHSAAPPACAHPALMNMAAQRRDRKFRESAELNRQRLQEFAARQRLAGLPAAAFPGSSRGVAAGGPAEPAVEDAQAWSETDDEERAERLLHGAEAPDGAREN